MSTMERTNSPESAALSAAETKLVNRALGWAKAWNVINVAPARKLLEVTAPDGEKLYWTLLADPEPRLIFHEPVHFDVTVTEVKHDGCNAGHQPGDSWQFSRCTPNGMCATAYHTMYPVLHGLMLGSGRYDGPAAQGCDVWCPEDGEVKFHIRRHRWSPESWSLGNASAADS